MKTTISMIFKELRKRISGGTLDPQQQTRLFERLVNKPFWIWDIAEHKQEDIKTNGDCCFNHIIGLPQKDGIAKPLYDYEKIIFDSLVTGNSSNTNSFNKHLWIKKATGLVFLNLCSGLWPGFASKIIHYQVRKCVLSQALE
jgi:hypothetical protein